MAGETNLQFYSVNANDLLSPIVGKSEKKIQDLFKFVKKEGGIIFIDEIDSLPNRNFMIGAANSIIN